MCAHMERLFNQNSNTPIFLVNEMSGFDFLLAFSRIITFLKIKF